MKKLLILADIDSTHTEKWVCALLDIGYQIHLFSLRKSKKKWHEDLPNVQFSFQEKNTSTSLLSKLNYFKAIPQVKAIIKSFNPDFLHAHYASSYGLIGALSGFSPFYVSVWGSDVYEYPKKNLLTKLALKHVFNKSTKIFSTSRGMVDEINMYTTKPIETISFGINLNVFNVKNQAKETSGKITIGVVKSLEKIYGIDIIINAIKLLIGTHRNIELRLVGIGTLEEEYKKLVAELGLNEYVIFVGNIPHSEIVKEYQKLDIFVNPSRFESFGVSILEASASKLPVIATRAGGQVELVKENETGLLVEPENVVQLSEALLLLVENEKMRKEMGEAGRIFVENNYSFKSSLAKLIIHYQ